MNKKKTYDETDEIEFRLTHNVSDHYWLEWRYKEPRKFWFFKKYDKWKGLHYYTPGIFTPDEDPDDDFNWYWRGFHLGKKSEVQEYESIRRNIHTKKQLYDYYHVKENIDRYYRDVETHKKWVEETNRNIQKYVD